MQTIKEHIIFKLLTFMLVVTLLIPTATKFAHVFTHHKHKHDVCKGEKKSHLHETDIDCEFYKFKLNNYFLFSLKPNSFISVSTIYEIPCLSYNYLNNHRQLSFSLRGPPSLV